MRIILALLTLSSITCTANIQVSSTQHAAMPIAIVVLDADNTQLNSIAHTVAKDLNFTDQFAVTVKTISAATSKKNLKKIITDLCPSGTPLALCLNTNTHDTIEWRIFDTMKADMLEGKKYTKCGTIERGWGHAIADSALTTLTGTEGSFSSRIAYCKEVKNQTHSSRTLCITDVDGNNTDFVADSPTIKVAPRWNVDPHNPLIFYSEYGDLNVRLMSVDMHKNSKIASNMDGINMLPGFSPDGKAVVYCASNGNGSCQLYHHTKGTLHSFTRNSGNNISPIFIDSTHICFCSDAQTGNPQIYIGDLQTNHVHRITKGGYCTSPNYCPINNTIVYHAKVQNIMQLFLYDCATKKHSQLTYSPYNKHEACWSPCGNYLAWAQEQEGKSRIVSFNMITKKPKYLTSLQENCSYPHWSKKYDHFPVVT